EAPIEALRAFIEQNPLLPDIRLVKYSLAVRLTRENRYDEAAAIYTSINSVRRGPRIRRLAELYRQANVIGAQQQSAKYKLAEFLFDKENGVYFNDALWGGMQTYVFQAATDSRFTRAERDAQIALERKLKDDQEERWRAYLILRELVRDSGRTE